MSSDLLACGSSGAAFFRNDFFNHFGFHGDGVKSNFYQNTKEDNTTEALFWNISVVVNMIPGIGSLIAGIYHIAKGLSSEETDLILVGRGVAEILAGPVVAILDLIATLGRVISACSCPAQD